MDRFRHFTLSRPWLGWSWIAVVVFAVLLIHGSLLGLTDDEAYYWVLGQKPAWGFAYHPPMIAWLIGMSSWLFGDSAFAVRFPAALCAGLSVLLALYWMDAAGAHGLRLWKGVVAVISFAGFFGLAWMSVPDLPLFLGWMLVFASTWEICFASPHHRLRWNFLALAAGIAIATLSKYSGVLIALSSAAALFFWAARGLRFRGWIAIATGLFVAAVPIVIWNAQHEWASILYQVKGRHEGAGFSVTRYLRFWLVELVVAGPFLVAFSFAMLRRSERPLRFVAVFALPALVVFCVQPLFSDFKPHWAFVAWWPAALGLGWSYARGDHERDRKWARWQSRYGIVVMVFILLSCHLPLQGWISASLGEHEPRFDVTNDLYGWRRLPDFLVEQGLSALPVIGSRYQTAAQAAFVLGSVDRVALVPRDQSTRDEWPMLSAVSSFGPEWPRLLEAVIYVGDNRYDLAPAFQGARCESLGKVEERRFGLSAKSVLVWRCDPAI